MSQMNYGSGAQNNNTGDGAQYNYNGRGYQNNGPGQQYISINHIGKSTIARTIARRYSTQKRLGANFFFSTGGGDISHAGKFVTSIAVQLANNVLSLKHYICKAITAHSNIASKSLRDQWDQLILGPLSELYGGSHPSSYVLVIDALDECDGEKNIQIILQLLAKASSLEPGRLRILITSRPTNIIQQGFYDIPESEYQDFVLHSIPSSDVALDIYTFVEYHMRIVGRLQKRSLEAGWPSEEVIRRLVENAGGLFIWAATACRFILEGGITQVIKNRLSTILQNGSTTSTAPEKHLNEIYITVLKHSISLTLTDEEKEDLNTKLRDILGKIVILLSPLSTHSLSRLLDTQEEIDKHLEDLHAILDIPKDRIGLIRLHHPSFSDFWLKKERCSDLNFWVDEKQAHQALAYNCIRLLSNSLKQDICGLIAPGTLVAEVENSQVEQCIPPEVRYACLYWIRHLEKSAIKLHDNDQVYRFLQLHLLHWLEALSWIGNTSEGILAISSLAALVSVDENPDLYTFIHDAKRFALHTRSLIEQAPLQVYRSSLIFAPETSIVRRQFEKCILPWIQPKPKVPLYWDATLQVLEAHTSWVYSVAFSHDSKLLASASHDATVRIWDAVLGELRQTISVDTPITNLSFDSEDRYLATNLGLIALDGIIFSLTSKSSQLDGGNGNYHGLAISLPWITWKNKKLLWLPPVYRSPVSAILPSGLTVAIGCSSGKVFIIGFSVDI